MLTFKTSKLTSNRRQRWTAYEFINKKEILMIGDDQEVDIGGNKIYTFRHIYSKLGNTANRPNLKSIESSYILPKLSLS